MSELFVASYVGLWILVLLQGVILLGVTRGLYEVRKEFTEPSLKGRRVPTFSTVDIWGKPLSSDSIMGMPTVMLFVSPDCSTCTVTLEELKPLVNDKTRGLVIVCGGAGDECRQLALDYELSVPIVADADDELKRLFEVTGTPLGVRISAQGVVESHGEPARGELFEELAARHRGPQEIGDVVGDRAAV